MILFPSRVGLSSWPVPCRARVTTRPLGLLTLIACTHPGDPGTTERRPANLLFYGDTTTITVDSTTVVATPLSIAFITFGGGCIGKGETETEIIGLQADLRPYQYVYHPRSNEACTSELRLDQNQVTVQFSAPGTARIRITGLRQPGDQPVTLERTVIVTQ